MVAPFLAGAHRLEALADTVGRSYDLAIVVDGGAERIGDVMQEPKIVVLKSTVPVGTNRMVSETISARTNSASSGSASSGVGMAAALRKKIIAWSSERRRATPYI